jgi:hypothetical protein
VFLAGTLTQIFAALSLLLDLFFGIIRRITWISFAFWDKSFMHHIWQVKIGQFRIPDYVPGEVQVLLRRILVVNPTRRYTVRIAP